MIDPHDAFRDWLLSGAQGEITPDVARHATGCRICLRSAASFDALSMVDPGAARPPSMPDSSLADRPVLSAGALRAAVGSSGVVLLAAIVATNIGGLVSTSSDLFTPGPTESSREDVLAGEGGASPTPSVASATIAAIAPDSFASPSGSPAPPSPSGTMPPPLTPVVPSTNPTVSPSPSNQLPPPGVTASPAPTDTPPSTATPSPIPTPTPTPIPTLSPTPTPTPTPSPTPTPTAIVDPGGSPPIP